MEIVNGIQHTREDGSVLRYACWNPVLFQPGNASELILFYKVGKTPQSWWGMMTTSVDSGRNWSIPLRLPEGIYGPIKNKPIELPCGTWLCPSSTEESDIPNPDSGTDATTLQDGTHALIHNPTEKGRSPLSLSLSADGIHWQRVLDLETDPGEYSYPSILQSDDGTLHILYTWRRKRIKPVAVRRIR